MSYIPLHHKYRPQTFAQLVGQEAIATTLSNALTQKRIAPAYLFTGARGTGKTSSARILAKSLNCIAGSEPTPHPCGQCETCSEITQGSALDVIEIDAASNTGVDNIRELIERAQFAPVRCRYKVYVIDEVHMLSNAAFNALLKTLEEPPERVVFVLATTDPQRVLPTIISRCQRFDFRRIPLEAMVQHLGHIAQREQIAIAPNAVQLVAQISQGGMRDAESLLDQLSLLAGEVTVEKVWDLVGAVPERDLMALVQAIATDDPETMLDHTRRLMDRGREPLIVLQNLASFYRDLLIAKTAPQRNDLVAITPPTWAEMTAFVQSVDIGWLLAGQQHLRSAEVQIKNTTQPRLWLEVTLMGLLPSAIATVSLAPQPSAAPPVPRSLTYGYGIEEIPVLPSASSSQVPQSLTSQPAAKTAPKPSPKPTQAPTPLSSTVTPKAAPARKPTNPPLATSVTEGNVTPSNSQPIVQEPATQLDLEFLWQQILSQIDSAPARGIIKSSCQLLDFNGEIIKIGVLRDMHNLVRGQAEALRKACAQACNAHGTITLVPLESITATSEPSSSQTSGSFSPQTASKDPISDLRSQFEPSRIAPASPSSPPRTNPSSRSLPSPAFNHSSDADLDELSRATKSLANYFDGQIVIDDAAESSESQLQTPPPKIRPEPSLLANMPTVEELLAEDGRRPENNEDDDDVPF